MRYVALFAGLAVSGCAADPEPLTCESPQAPTWHNFGEGYVHTWCTPCHSTSVEVGKRQGAPVASNFDLHADVAGSVSLVQAVTGGDSPSMPPLGGITAEAREVFDLWLSCGAPGGDPAPDPCSSAKSVGAAVVTSPGEAQELCSTAAVSVDALSVSTDAALDCVCEVRGDLVVSGGTAALPQLAAVGGDLTVTGSALALSAPTLRDVAGSVRIDAVDLGALEVSQLGEVGGAFEVQDLTLQTLALLGLEEVGTFRVQDLPAVQQVRVPRLRSVAGDLRMADLPQLQSLSETNAVLRIGGDLVLERLGVDALDHWAFSFLQRVEGSVVIAENPFATDLGGFTLLGDPVAAGEQSAGIGGSLTIRANPALRAITGFDTLRAVPGDLLIEGHDTLDDIVGFKNLALVEGNLRLLSAPRLDVLQGFMPLTEVGGQLEIGATGGLRDLDGFDQVTEAGGIWLHDNAALRDLDGLRGLRRVTGDVTVVDNSALTTGEIDGWLNAVGRERISGEITVERNAK